MNPALALVAFVISFILCTLWFVWNNFTAWLYRKPWVAALAGLFLIVVGVWFKRNVDNLDFLPIPGLKGWVGPIKDIAESTLAPIGGSVFAAALFMRAQLLNSIDIKETRESIRRSAKIYKILLEILRSHESNEDDLSEEILDKNSGELIHQMWKIEKEIEKKAKSLRGSGGEISKEEIKRLLGK